MSRNEIEAKVVYLQELESFIEEIKEEADTIRNEIKAEMLDRNVTELQAGRFIIRWTDVLSNKFDTASFKRVYGDLYKAFQKQVYSKRFSIA